MINRYFRTVLIAGILLCLGFCVGCQKNAETSALEKQPLKYAAISEITQIAEFKGDVPAQTKAKGGKNYNKIVVEFQQQTSEPNEENIRTADITITDIRFLQDIRGNTVLDFDSKGKSDLKSPISKLIGKSYSVELKPNGMVTEINGAAELRELVKGNEYSNKAAGLLVTDKAIMRRHGAAAYPPKDKIKDLKPGNKWTSLDSFSFKTMGAKAYEKIYKVEEIKKSNGQKTAIINMEAIPTAKMAEELHEKERTHDFSKMFESEDKFTGQLKLDMNTGNIIEYNENLEAKWNTMVPQKKDKEPAFLVMTAERNFKLKKLD